MNYIQKSIPNNCTAFFPSQKCNSPNTLQFTCRLCQKELCDNCGNKESKEDTWHCFGYRCILERDKWFQKGIYHMLWHCTGCQCSGTKISDKLLEQFSIKVEVSGKYHCVKCDCSKN